MLPKIANGSQKKSTSPVSTSSTGAGNVAGSGAGGGSIGTGTPMRPVTSVNRGTPMRPVSPVSSRQLTYFGGTPTSSAGYKAYDEYFGGTPTGMYDPNAQPTSDSEKALIDQIEKNRDAGGQDSGGQDSGGLDLSIFDQPATLTPEQRQSYLQMKRDAERAYEQLLANARLQRGMARQDYRTGMRDTARQAAGSAQDMKTALAYLGLDTSPGVADVGVEDINTRANTAMAGLDAAWAQTQAEIKAMKAQARIDRQRALTAAEAWRSRTLGANTQDLQAQLTEILNGL